MRTLGMFFAVYALIGLALLLFGPTGKALRKSVRESRENALHAALLYDKPAVPEWKFWALGGLLGLTLWIAWPLLLPAAMADLKSTSWTDSLSPARRGRTFNGMGGAGNLSCRVCGHEEHVTCFLHGVEWDATGYQCQQCGKLHALENVCFDSELSLCECGGKLSRDDALTCPRCRSVELDYDLRVMT